MPCLDLPMAETLSEVMPCGRGLLRVTWFATLERTNMTTRSTYPIS
jgi:hypothetical protein